MANITAKEVQTLRARTGVGMMDCKRALVETDGDMEKAVLFLREKGLAAADKKASRIAAEGTIAIQIQGKTAALVEINAETDFVTKNPKFSEFASKIAEIAVDKKPVDLESLLELNYDEDKTVEEMRKEMVFVIGENISIRRFALVEGVLSAYSHGAGKIGVVTSFETELSAENEAFAEFAKNVCMQIAAMNPQYLDKKAVPASEIENEKNVLLAQIKNDPKLASKPQAVIEKMVDGRLNKFYEQNCLLDQLYFKEENLSIEKYVEATAKELGSAIKISSFVRYEKGEGIQKRDDNFAEEVAKIQGK